MLRLPRFDYHRASSVADAAAVLSGEGAAAGRSVRLVAGGTDLWPNLKRRHQKADVVVSLMQVPELAGIRASRGEIRLGATTTLAAIERDPTLQARFPTLVDAVASISSPVLRRMGTLGGNLCLDTRCTYYNQSEAWRQAIGYCMKAEGTVCWVAPSSPRCWAVASSDAAPMLCALEAQAVLVSTAGERTLPLADLYRDDGMDYLAKRPDEVLTEVRLPASSDATRVRAGWFKLRRRGSIDFATLSIAAALWIDAGGHVERANLFLGAVASEPRRAGDAAESLLGRTLDEASVGEAARRARRVATPFDNTDFQAAWRGRMVETQTARLLRSLVRPSPGAPAVTRMDA